MAVTVVVELDSEGVLASLDSRGHAIDRSAVGPGTNVVCSAVTTLVRTAARLLAEDPAVVVRGEAPEPGVLSLQVATEPGVPGSKRDWLHGVTDFLLCGLRDVVRDYPEEITLAVKEE